MEEATSPVIDSPQRWGASANRSPSLPRHSTSEWSRAKVLALRTKTINARLVPDGLHVNCAIMEQNPCLSRRIQGFPVLICLWGTGALLYGQSVFHWGARLKTHVFSYGELIPSATGNSITLIEVSLGLEEFPIALVRLSERGKFLVFLISLPGQQPPARRIIPRSFANTLVDQMPSEMH